MSLVRFIFHQADMLYLKALLDLFYGRRSSCKNPLRCYATFKRRKSESFYKINTCWQKKDKQTKNLPLVLDCWQRKYSLILYNIHIFKFWVRLLQFLSYVISKSLRFLTKKSSELIFAALDFYIDQHWSYLKLEILIFFSFVVSFLGVMFN